MNKKTFYIFFLVESLILLNNACQPPIGVTTIKVETVAPVKSLGDNEPILLSNCDKNVELEETLGSLKAIQKTTIVNKIATNDTGSDYNIPGSVNLQLEIELEKTYSKIFEITNLRLEGIHMNVTPGQQMKYVIQWESLVYQSKILFTYKGDVYRVPYSYKLIVPKLIYEEQINCPGVTIISTQTSQLPTLSSEIGTTFPATNHVVTLKIDNFLYAGPNIGNSTVSLERRLKGEKFSVVAKNPRVDWLLVRASDGTQGWLYVSWLVIDFDLEIVPVTTIFPTPPIPIPASTNQSPISYP